MTKQTQTLTLPDGRKITAPATISLNAKTSVLDEMEYELWNIVKQYFAVFGIELKPEENGRDTPDFYTVKTMQDALIDILTESGVNFTQ